MYADSLCQKDRSAMALSLQAQTLADAAKVTPLPCSTPTFAMSWLCLFCYCLSADGVAVCLP